MQLPQLTFTRFVAALIVLIFHGARGSYPFTVYPGRYLVDYGSLAVVYFFILSGFILGITYQSAFAQTGQLNKRRFWVARIARIYPLYLFALLLMVFVQTVFYQTPATPLALVTSLTLVQAWFPSVASALNGPGWSLSVEALFYAAFPFLFLWLTTLRTRALLGLLPLVWAVGVGVFYWLLNSVDPATLATEDYHNLVNYSPWIHLPTFINGCICGLLFWRYRQQQTAEATRNRLGWAALVAGFAGLAVAVHYPNWMTYGQGGSIAPVFALFILGLSVQHNTALTRLFAWRPLVYLGEISYGLYILQMPVIRLLKQIDPLALGDTVWRDLFTFGVLFGASALCYHLIEKPAQAFIRTRWSGRAVTQTRQAPA